MGMSDLESDSVLMMGFDVLFQRYVMTFIDLLVVGAWYGGDLDQESDFDEVWFGYVDFQFAWKLGGIKNVFRCEVIMQLNGMLTDSTFQYYDMFNVGVGRNLHCCQLLFLLFGVVWYDVGVEINFNWENA